MTTEANPQQPGPTEPEPRSAQLPVSFEGRGGAGALLLVILLAFAGAYISFVLTVYHMSQGRRATGVYELMCGQQGAGCEQVLQSRWGYVGNTNVPVAAVGLAYFLSLGLWYLVVGRANRSGRWWQLVPLLLNLAGVGWSICFIWIMLAVVRGICWWCLTTHIINLIMLVLAFVLWPGRPAAGPARPSLRLSVAGLLLMASALAVTLTTISAAQWRRLARASSEMARRYRNDPGLMAYAYHGREKKIIPLRADDPVMGPADARHTVVVFGDFRCNACRKLAALLRDKVLPAYPDQIRVVFKHYPLDNTCNPHAKWGTSFNSCAAAQAAEAAYVLGGDAGFWRMHDQLFEHRADLGGRPDFEAWADDAGLDGARIARAVADGTYRERVVEDIELGAELGVQGTPTVFLDGKKLGEWHRLEIWQAILHPQEFPASQEEVEGLPFEVLDVS